VRMIHGTLRFAPLFLLAIAWEGLTRTHVFSPSMLPPLSAVLESLFHMLRDDLVYQTSLSIMRGAAGLGAAILIGVPLGVLMAWYRPMRLIVKPLIQLFYPLPKSALIPLAIVWLGLGSISKIVLIMVGCLLPIVLSSFNATRGVDKFLVWSARSVGASESELLWEIVVPAGAPEILNGIRIALALCFILVVAGEFIFANNGIGFLISFLGDGGDYEGMFAGILTVSVLGFAADRIFLVLMGRFTSWQVR
jgi:NitT/TauT family transport system permease protein